MPKLDEPLKRLKRLLQFLLHSYKVKTTKTETRSMVASVTPEGFTTEVYENSE